MTLLGVLGGEALAHLIPEAILRKIAAVMFVGMGLLIWSGKI